MPNSDHTSVQVPGGEVRIFEPLTGDLGRMYVLDVLGLTIMVREREDGMYVAVDNDGMVGDDTPDKDTILVEVANGGVTVHGQSI